MLIVGAALYLILLFFSASHAKIGQFWHITDIHYDAHYSTSGDVKKHCWRTENGRVGLNRSPGRYGDYECDSPWALVESAVRAMRSQHGDNVEFILWTGDGSSHNSARTPELQLAALENITALLKHSFSSQFVFPVLGHEDASLNYANLSHLWRYWLPTEAIRTFDAGGYYSIEMKMNKLRLVLMNTNLYTGKHDKEDPEGQFSWLEATLEKSQKNKETVYIVGHIPPGMDDRLSAPHRAVFQERFTNRYMKLVQKFSDNIVGQFFGHLHSDTFRVVYDNNGKPVSWMMVAPSITPRRWHGASSNPGLRIYNYNTDTGQILDYVQYFLDLERANAKDQAVWAEEYKFSSYYGVSEITPTSMADLAVAFTDPGRLYLAEKYNRAISVRRDISSCDSACAHAHFCAATRLDYEEFRGCLDTAASSLTSAAAGAMATPGVVLALVAAAAVVALQTDS